jgi:signal transduction histidine kinase
MATLRPLSPVGESAEADVALRFQEQRLMRVVHNLKNPLSVISANLELVLAERPEDEMVADALGDALGACRRMARQLDNIVDTVRIECGAFELRPQTVSLVELFARVAQRFRKPAEEGGVSLEIDVDVDARAQLDEALVLRVMCNLLDNGVRYTAAGGTIRLAAERGRIVVANTGEPIPLAARAGLFTRPAPSTVLCSPNRDVGLYFCRLAAEAHGGRLWLEERPGFPVVFVIELPA